MATQFSWLTFSQAKTDLASRLADPNKVFWVDDELSRYIVEALRTYNAHVSLWNDDYALNLSPPLSSNWISLASIAGYPRQRTVTDTELYAIMRYHLLEIDPSAGGGGWTRNWGHNWALGATPPTVAPQQFTTAMMAAALQRRRDEIIQITACNVATTNLPALPNIRDTQMPDTVLELFRNRFIPSDTSIRPVTLWRDDELAFSYYEPGFEQNHPNTPGYQPKLPQAYSVITGPPLAFSVDLAPPLPGIYELLYVKSQAQLTPSVPSILGIPNDWCWLDKWGALGDLLNQESECTDIPRAEYCMQRYWEGMKLMAAAPWLLLGRINGVPTDTVSVTEMDQYDAEWDSNPDASECVVTAGTDLVALSPNPSAAVSAVLTVVRNAPIPILDNDFVQVSRDTWDVILDYAQHLAQFKQGGAEFLQSIDLYKNFIKRCASENSRISELGLYDDILNAEGNREREVQPRFAEE